jgi:hypothetical protein
MSALRLAATLFLFLTFHALAGCASWGRARPTLKTPLAEISQQIHLRADAPLKAGAARVEITPRVGTPLAGYAKRRGKPSVGIRDPLYVRALALSDGEDTALLISVDLLVFPAPLAERIAAQVSSELKIPRQGIVLATTHTHSGSGSIATGFLHQRVFGRYRSDVTEGLTARIAWAARQAVGGLKPVRWGVTSSPRTLEGLVENRRLPGGPVDPSVGVLFFEAVEDGKIQAVVVSAAAHPTLLDAMDLRMSADFPGELTRNLEAVYPGAACLFLNGAAGDARPRDAVGGTPDERIQRFGGAMAEAVTGLVNQAAVASSGDLAVWGGWLKLPAPQMRLGLIPIHPRIGRLMRPGSFFLNLIGLDGFVLAAVPAEPTTALGLELKQRLAQRGLRPLVVGYSGSYLGYAVTPEEFRSRSYEASMSWYGPEFGTALVDYLDQYAGLYAERLRK